MPTNNFASEMPDGFVKFLSKYMEERNARIDSESSNYPDSSDGKSTGSKVSTKNFNEDDYDNYPDYEG